MTPYGSAGLIKSKVSKYPIFIQPIYNNHGKLMKMGIMGTSHTADEIGTVLQEQIDLFYAIFVEKFGKPCYVHPNAKHVPILNFLGQRWLSLYIWETGNVSRDIMSRKCKGKYDIYVFIRDTVLA
ncbi:unnamed protein product, partial [marine sediment metagenome]